MTDPNMHWDGTRWLRYDGQQWLDAATGQPLTGPSVLPPAAPFAPPPAPSKPNITMLALIIGGAVVAVLVLILVVVAMTSTKPVAAPTSKPTVSTATPSPTASVSSSPTASPEEIAATITAIKAVDDEMAAYNTTVKKAGRTHKYGPALAHLDAAQRNLSALTTTAQQVDWPATPTDTMASASQIAAYETAASNWIAVQREIALGLQRCFAIDGGMTCVNRVAKRTEAQETAATAALRSAWIAMGGQVK